MGRFFRYAALATFFIATLAARPEPTSAQVTISGNASIQSQASIGISRADDVPVKAGEDVGFTVTLDKPPNFEGGTVQCLITSPSGATISMGTDLHPGEVKYKLRYLVPAAAPAGVWTIKVTGIFDGLNTIQLMGRLRPFESLRIPTWCYQHL